MYGGCEGALDSHKFNNKATPNNIPVSVHCLHPISMLSIIINFLKFPSNILNSPLFFKVSISYQVLSKVYDTAFFRSVDWMELELGCLIYIHLHTQTSQFQFHQVNGPEKHCIKVMDNGHPPTCKPSHTEDKKQEILFGVA